MRWLLICLPLLVACENDLQPAACEGNEACTRAICVDGRCAAVECAAPADCPSGTCELGRCVAIECRAAAECSGGLICAAGLCVPPDTGYTPPPPQDAAPLPERDAVAFPDARVVDAGPDAALPTGLAGRYQLEMTLARTDCEDLDGSPSGNVRLEIVEGEPLRGLLEGATNTPILLRGTAEDLSFTLATTEPALVDALLCQFGLEIELEGVRQPGGGVAGSVVWTLSDPEACEALSLDCARTDDFIGTRLP